MIGIADRPAERVGEQLRAEGARELVFPRHQPGLVFLERAEPCPIRELPADIQHGRVGGANALAVEALSPFANGVVVLQREAEWVELEMAGGANLVAAMQLQPLAHR